MFAMMVGAVLNTILDPLFIFVFHWGVEGAALATILSQLIGMLFNVAYLFRFRSIRLERASFALEGKVIRKIMGLGFASCINNLTSTIVSFVSNNLLTKYGALSPYGPDIPLTTFGLCMKVSMLALSIGIGVGQRQPAHHRVQLRGQAVRQGEAHVPAQRHRGHRDHLGLLGDLPNRYTYSIRIFARNPPSMRSLPWTVSTSTCSW